MTLNNVNKFVYLTILVIPIFFIIKSFYPFLLGLLYFFASLDFPILNEGFRIFLEDLEIIIHVYTISLGILFVLNYFEKNGI
jgi:hypothetical protein